MLRIIFSGLATCVLLLAAGAWFAREEAPEGVTHGVREALGSALGRAIESAKQALPRLPQPRPAGRASLDSAAEAPAPSTAASSTPPPPASKPMPPPAQAAVRPSAREVETVTEESISPLWSAPFVEAPEAGLGSAREGDPERQAPPARIPHHPSPAGAHLPTPTRDFGGRLLDAPTGTPPSGALRKDSESPEIPPPSTNLHALAAGRGEKSGLVAAAPSQDEWAGLIRRMLAIYERVGAAE